jgi:hypothetical protein
VLKFIRACSSNSQTDTPIAVGWDSNVAGTNESEPTSQRDAMTHSRPAEAVERAIAARSHRVWILDEQQRPVNVFSLSNLLSLFLPKQARGGHTPQPASVISTATQASS